MTRLPPTDLTESQKAHIGRVLHRLENLAFELRTNAWADTNQSDSINAAQQHLEQAYEHLNQALPAPGLPTPPLTGTDFLNTPLQQNPDVDTWMYNRLWELSRELSQSNHPHFTAQELLDNGLTISRFQRVNGVGQTKLAQLKAIFRKHRVAIPL